MQLYTLDTGLFKLDGGAMFGVVPKSMWSKVYPSDEINMCTWAMRCMLVQEGNRLILIDTGIGNKQGEKFLSHFYLHGDDSLEKSLNKYGFTSDDITDVILTHLHFDHCGGAIKREGENLVPAFANATYWSNESHWKSATMPNEREAASFLKENILPIQESGQLKFIEEKNGISFSENIEMHFVSGHTESMMLPLINYKGNKILFAADLFPSPHHVGLPWIMAYDMQPLVTLQDKKRILEIATKENWLLAYEHDMATECSNIVVNERGVAKAGDKLLIRDL